MSDRTMRFAARMIAVGLLGVAWAIGTLTMVVVLQTATATWQLKAMGYAGLLPVAGLLIYIVLTDLADWRASRRDGGEDWAPGIGQDRT